MEAQTSTSPIVSAQAIRERAVKTRAAQEDKAVSELEVIVAQVIESVHAEKNEANIPVQSYEQDVVLRVVSRLKAEGYRVRVNSPMFSMTNGGAFANSLDVYWNA